jgi:hypothetical protein
MPDIAINGSSKSFYRVLTGNGQYAPDATTIGGRERSATGDDAINEQLDAVVQASGEGFVASPGLEFSVRFIGWTDATCVIQEYNFYTAAWETFYTFSTPLVEEVFKVTKVCAFRIGASAIGSDAASLKVIIQHNRGDLGAY